MSIQIEIEDHPQYVAARFKGHTHHKDLATHFADIIARCQQAQVRKYLSDFREVQMSLSTVDRYEFGRSAQVFGQAGITVAVLVPPALLDARKFGELVAQNAGTRLRVFTEEAPALAWLLAQ